MITSYPMPLAHAEPETPPQRTLAPPVRTVATDGSWRYNAGGIPRVRLVAAALLSAAMHLALIFGVGPEKKNVVAPPPEQIIALTLAMPDLKDLEELEPLPVDDSTATADLATLVPMQADLPQLPSPDDFVQPLNFSSLVEKPDFSDIAISIIPENFRGGRKLAESIGQIFNLSDLDRIPEPLLQTAPVYPLDLRRDGISGVVRLEFVVDTQGLVTGAHVVETSHHGFSGPAIAAVSRWKFRPGIKGGRKVNTRMAVPIVFSVADRAE